ncbi:MAG: hypothetical protein PHF70_15215 [Opitutales bacterium]|nr:hypothetical protein [Opitutales bacterium]
MTSITRDLPNNDGNNSNWISEMILKLISEVPESTELPVPSTPDTRAAAIAHERALLAAGISGTLALPPGPAGMATLPVDLLTILKLQRKMIADIAAVYGKTGDLNPTTMLICMVKYGSAGTAGRMLLKAGSNKLVKRTTQQMLRKLGVRVSQQAVGKSISRWAPAVGAAAIAGYAYMDTKHVANRAIELFSQPVVLIAA